MAIDLISTHIRKQLQERSNKLRQKIAVPHKYISSPSGTSTPEAILEDLDLTILKSTPQLEVRPPFGSHYLKLTRHLRAFIQFCGTEQLADKTLCSSRTA